MADGNAVAVMQPRSVIAAMAARAGMDPKPFELALRSVMPPNHSDVEFAACALVANQYDLNPFTKQIYFMRTKSGQIQPIVSVDGWAWIVNRNEAHDGMEFVDHFDDKKKLTAITCRIYRKDRSKPVEVTEYMAECAGQSPAWKQTPSRMLRHRAMIQCARYAYSVSGIMEADEFSQWQEADDKATRKSAYRSKKDGGSEEFNRIKAAVAAAETIKQLDDIIEGNRATLDAMPAGWEQLIQDEYDLRHEQLAQALEAVEAQEVGA